MKTKRRSNAQRDNPPLSIDRAIWRNTSRICRRNSAVWHSGAASAKSNTGAMAEVAANNAGARNLVYIPGFLLLAGGVPVKAGDEVVGAIGVGGAPGGNLDEECANAGLQAIAAKLK